MIRLDIVTIYSDTFHFYEIKWKFLFARRRRVLQDIKLTKNCSIFKIILYYNFLNIFVDQIKNLFCQIIIYLHYGLGDFLKLLPDQYAASH